MKSAPRPRIPLGVGIAIVLVQSIVKSHGIHINNKISDCDSHDIYYRFGENESLPFCLLKI